MAAGSQSPPAPSTGNGAPKSDAPKSDAPKPDAPKADPPRATTTARPYVVLEDGGENGIIVHGEVEATTPDDACWALIEKDGSELNKRAVGAGNGTESAPRLAGVLASRLSFDPYVLESVVETRRKRG